MTTGTNIAVIGAGGFAHFATSEFLKVPGVHLFGVYDENKNNALRLKELSALLKIYDSIEQLCAEPAIDLVYIATPPFL
ncbi:MAG TPA: Gfo/Idh/MocA family oxidoreductase, partial [Cyclobacteriaceae bacterium]|nr:Gfo/Idh/MocA family oxidoreductase [Cyclobacteriaceae bacterium]